jgi:hypothetical protein
MNTESQMIGAALRIANEGPYSRVVFFVPTWERAQWIAKTVLDNLSLYDGAKFSHQYMQYAAKDGGLLLIRVIDREKQGTVIAGMQMSHAFCLDVWECEPMIRSRIRTPKEHKTLPGLFGQYGVLRMMDY